MDGAGSTNPGDDACRDNANACYDNANAGSDNDT